MEKNPNFFDKIEKIIYNSQKYFGALEIVEFVVFLIIVYKYNPFNISSSYPAYTQLGVLIVGFIYIILFFFIKYNFIQNINLFNLGLSNPTELDIVKRILITFAFLVLFIITTIGIFWIFRHKNIFFLLFKYFVSILSIAGLLGMIYLLTNKFFSKIFDFGEGNRFGSGPAIEVLKLIKNIILFLPCLLISFVETMRYQFNITTKPVWIIFIMEILLIILWFIVPKIMNWALSKNGTLLLKEPLYLNQEHSLGDFENMHLNNLNSDDKGKKFNYHYAVSAWFTINPQPPNTRLSYTKYTTILNYGNKPAIRYNSKTNSLLVNTEIIPDNISISTDNKNNNVVEIFETNDIMFQKWNNIVINYDGGTMDVFLNGVLVGSKPNIAPYMTYENITIGENKGIEGAICNVVYYDEILANRTIKLVYNYLKNKEIPLLY